MKSMQTATLVLPCCTIQKFTSAGTDVTDRTKMWVISHSLLLSLTDVSKAPCTLRNVGNHSPKDKASHRRSESSIVRIINKIQLLLFIFNTLLYEMQQLAVSKENCNGLQNQCSIPGRSRDFLFVNPPDRKVYPTYSGRPFERSQCGRWVKLSNCLHLVLSKVCAQIYIHFPKSSNSDHLSREITLNIICKHTLSL
jgi:hypothetical protein